VLLQVFEGHFRHSSAGGFDQQSGATRTDVPVANHFRDVELRRDIPPEIGANLLICPPDKRHIQFLAYLPNGISDSKTNVAFIRESPAGMAVKPCARGAIAAASAR